VFSENRGFASDASGDASVEARDLFPVGALAQTQTSGSVGLRWQPVSALKAV
jgi:hypothetical protein